MYGKGDHGQQIRHSEARRYIPKFSTHPPFSALGKKGYGTIYMSRAGRAGSGSACRTRGLSARETEVPRQAVLPKNLE